MGLVYEKNAHLVKDYPEETVEVTDAILEVGQQSVAIKQAPMTANEVRKLLQDCDALARTRSNEMIASWMAEEFPSILANCRWVLTESKSGYAGMRGTGRQLVATWLRGAHVGVTAITNDAGTASKGLYAGTVGAVYTWLKTWVAGTSQTMIPAQVLSRETGITFLGFMDTIDIPKVDAASFSISGIALPVLAMKFNNDERRSTNDTAVWKLAEPVMYGPKKTMKVDLYPNITGDSKIEPLAVLITMASNLTV